MKVLSGRGIPTLVALALTGAAGPSRGQEPADLPLDLGIGDELALLAEEDVVVSATRHAQPIEESPSAITVLTRADIRASGYDDLSDLMRLVPGADVVRMTPMQAAIGLRSGSTVAGDLLVVLVDGRDARAHFLGQPVWSALAVDIDSIERIEIIRGPASTLYGANAIQGVVNIVTREPTERPLAAETTVHASGLQTFSADARVHGSQGGLRWWVSGGHEEGGPLETTAGRSGAGASRARGFVGWRPGEGSDLVFEVGLLSVSGEFSSVLGPLAVDMLWPHASGRIEFGSTEIQLTADMNRFQGAMDPGLVMTGDTPDDDLTLAVLGPLAYESRALELTGHHALDLFRDNRLTVGLAGRLVSHASDVLVECPDVDFASFDPGACAPLSELEQRAGAFLQDEWRLHPTLTLTTGIRVDVNSHHPEPGISPRAALVWRFADGQALRASAGRAYREPSFTESQAHVALLPGDAGVPSDVLQRVRYIFATQVGNPDLLNENATSVELGWRGRFLEGRLSTTVDLFYSTLSDLIFMDIQDLELRDGFGGLPMIPDTARASFINSEQPYHSVGGEAAVRWRPAPWVDLGLSYGADLALGPAAEVHGESEPDHRVIGTFRVRRPGGLRLSLDAIWSSGYRDVMRAPRSAMDPRIETALGDVFLINAGLGWAATVGGGDLEVGVAGYNVLAPGQREAAGVDLTDGGSAGAMRLAPQARIYLRGSF